MLSITNITQEREPENVELPVIIPKLPPLVPRAGSYTAPYINPDTPGSFSKSLIFWSAIAGSFLLLSKGNPLRAFSGTPAPSRSARSTNRKAGDLADLTRRRRGKRLFMMWAKAGNEPVSKQLTWAASADQARKYGKASVASCAPRGGHFRRHLVWEWLPDVSELKYGLSSFL